MLPERYSKLLSAYVDGGLAAREEETVRRLLQRSSEARALLKDFEANAARLKQLPQHKLEPTFASEVMQEVDARGIRGDALQPASRFGGATAPMAKGLPGWLGIAIAATVLLAVTIGSYLFFANLGAPETPAQLVQQPRIQQRPPRIETPPKEEEPPLPPSRSEPSPLVNSIIAGIQNGFHRPVGAQFAARDLADDKMQQRLARELRQSNALHLDLASRDNGTTVKTLIGALSNQKLQVLVDDRVQVSMNSGNPQAAYLVYAENIRADDLTKILQQLGGDVASDQVDTIHISALTNRQRTELSTILGVDPRKLEAPPPMELLNPVPTAPPKAKGKKDQGEPAPAKAPELGPPLALVLPLETGVNRSTQIRDFLASRKNARPGSIQVLLVIHAST